MKIIKNSNENEVILEFLIGEIVSERFNEELQSAIYQLHFNADIIIKGNVKSPEEN